MSTTTNTVSFNAPFEVTLAGYTFGGTVWGTAEVDYEGDDVNEPMFRTEARLIEFEIEDLHDSDGEEASDYFYEYANDWVEDNFEDFI
jgi:hypothetical protein